MKQISLALFMCAALTACNSGGKKTEPSVKTDTTSTAKPTKDTADPTAATTVFPADFKPGKTFSYDKADLHESLKVQELNEKTIAYELSMVSGECPQFTFKGIATLKEGDAESDIDEKGDGFFVDEYVDDKNGKCGVTVRIGGDEGYTNRARFYIYDCAASCKNQQESQPLKSIK